MKVSIEKQIVKQPMKYTAKNKQGRTVAMTNTYQSIIRESTDYMIRELPTIRTPIVIVVNKDRVSSQVSRSSHRQTGNPIGSRQQGHT